jgi:acyl-CoA thioester hydrolase
VRIVRNEFFRADGKMTARVSSTGGWLDLGARRLAVPPPQLLAALSSLPQTVDFAPLPSALKT